MSWTLYRPEYGQSVREHNALRDGDEEKLEAAIRRPSKRDVTRLRERLKESAAKPCLYPRRVSFETVVKDVLKYFPDAKILHRGHLEYSKQKFEKKA